MNFETLLNTFNAPIDEEVCASLTSSFCPEIVTLLNSHSLNAKKTFSYLLPTAQDYGFDEHAHGLS
ncbi:MAG: hypothetical protein WCJ11_11100 [Methylococcaceae bacterium]